MITRYWLAFALGGTALDALTTLLGVLTVAHYEQNGLVNGFGLVWALLVTVLLAGLIIPTVRYVTARRPRYNALLSSALALWGLSRWTAVIVFGLGANGFLR